MQGEELWDALLGQPSSRQFNLRGAELTTPKYSSLAQALIQVGYFKEPGNRAAALKTPSKNHPFARDVLTSIRKISICKSIFPATPGKGE